MFVSCSLHWVGSPATLIKAIKRSGCGWQRCTVHIMWHHLAADGSLISNCHIIASIVREHLRIAKATVLTDIWHGNLFFLFFFKLFFKAVRHIC